MRHRLKKREMGILVHLYFLYKADELKHIYPREKVGDYVIEFFFNKFQIAKDRNISIDQFLIFLHRPAADDVFFNTFSC